MSWIVGWFVVLLFTSILSTTTVSASTCHFVLGFRTLHDLIPDVVGDCLVDEHHNPENGDGLQETTRGLLVWRKSDNFTAFTDGHRTWVNGPNGLRMRLNTESFAWERPTVTPTPQPIAPIPAATGRIFLIRIDDGGRNGQAIGCGDSLIAVDRPVPSGNDRALQVRFILASLFTAPSSTPPTSLYNVFTRSTLRIDDVRIDGGRLEVDLSGRALIGGVCDAPRFEGQIKATLQQFSWVEALSVLVNGIPIERVFSGRG